MKRLADSGAAKMRAAQNKNSTYTNVEAQLHKHEPKPLKAKRWKDELALPREVREANNSNWLQNGLGKKGVIGFQDISEEPPKPSLAAGGR